MPVYLLAYLKNQIRKLRQLFMHAAGAVVRSSFDDDVYPVFNHLKVIVMSPLENLCSITSIDVTSISIIHSNSLCFMDE